MDRKYILDVYRELTRLREEVIQGGDQLYKAWEPTINRMEFLPSARNLSYYLAIRKHDLRELQEKLIPLGLSSLGRLESRTLFNIDAVLSSLGRILACEDDLIDYHNREDFELGRRLLECNTAAAIGAAPKGRYTRIMVTLPTEAGESKKMVEELMANGMNVARINCAHDNPDIWLSMIQNVHRAAKAQGVSCKILMDIAGPKMRIRQVLTTLQRTRVREGDRIFLAAEEKLWNYRDIPVVLSLTEREIVPSLPVGQRVLIDDGQIETAVEEISPYGAVLRVQKVVRPEGVNIRPEKGVNFPGAGFQMPILSEQDRAHIQFASRHADMVACSFIRDKEDIRAIEEALVSCQQQGAPPLPLILKIETLESVDIFPLILVEAARNRPVGVMIARGDLAVEIGYERLSEIQEEILWICEAAHIPVIWATQVLENLVKTGIPTRAEITDVTTGAQAECIMLNKGDHLADGVKVLNDILRKFEKMQYKKTPRLRALGMASKLSAEGDG
jgi:pyruvate kinase